MTDSLIVVRDCLLVFAEAAAVYLLVAAAAALGEWLKRQKRWGEIAKAIAWVEAHGWKWPSEQKLLTVVDRVFEHAGLHVQEDDVERVLQWMKGRGELVERKKPATQG